MSNIKNTDMNTPIEKLEGINNYVNWKFALQMILTLDGLWKCVLGEDADETRDSRALARICLAIKPNLYQYVRDCKKAKDAWQKLADTFESKGLYRKVLLLRQLHKVDYKQYSSMSEYIEAVMRLVRQLDDIGKTIEDDEVAEILLSGLSQEFDNLVSGLETACLTSKLTSELVRTRLLQEEHRKNGDQEGCTAYYTKKKKTSSPAPIAKKPDTQLSDVSRKRKTKRKITLCLRQPMHTPSAGKRPTSLFWTVAAHHICVLTRNYFLEQKEHNMRGSCESCLTGKMHNAPYPTVGTDRATQPLQLVHSDVIGPMQVSSWGGFRYLLTFTDNCTRKTWGYLK